MLQPLTKEIILPPVVSTVVVSERDVLLARDTARRAAMLVGLVPLYQARFSTAAAELARLVSKTKQPHRLDFFGVQHGMHHGIRLACQVGWLAGKPMSQIRDGLRQKLDTLVDDIDVYTIDGMPYIHLTIWYAVDDEAQGGQS